MVWVAFAINISAPKELIADYSLRPGLQNRLDVTGRQRFAAKQDVAFNTRKVRIGLSLIDLVVEYAAVICRDRNVTALGAAARVNRHSQ